MEETDFTDRGGSTPYEQNIASPVPAQNDMGFNFAHHKEACNRALNTSGVNLRFFTAPPRGVIFTTIGGFVRGCY